MALCFIIGSRIIRIPETPTRVAVAQAARGLTPRWVNVVLRRDGRVEVEADGDGCVVRGERRRRHVVAAGDALAVGSGRVLVAEVRGDEERAAARWQGMVAAERTSLGVLSELARAGMSRAPVWLAGESGTGKELAARALHAVSERAGHPFVAVNCAALPDNLLESELFGVERGAFTGASRTRMGAFQRAAGGTLFLDEVGELPLAAQAKILRALETREVQPVGSERLIRTDVRVISASWRDLERSVAMGQFRLDLLHRLWVLKVELPTLRARPGDLAPLIAHLLEQERVEGLMPDEATMAQLAAHPWPGNVRELRNCIARAVAAEDPQAMIPQPGRTQLVTESAALDEVRAAGIELPRRSDFDGLRGSLVRTTLAQAYGNRTRAAASLGVSRSTLYRWLDRAAA